MDNTPLDDILLLKQRLAEQETLVRTLQQKLSQREREIDHLQAQLDKLRRRNFGRQSEKMARRIAQIETDLKRLQQESDALTGRVDAPPGSPTVTPDPHPQTVPSLTPSR